MYSESGTGQNRDKSNNSGHIDLPEELKDPILRVAAGKLGALKQEIGSSLLTSEKEKDDISTILAGLSHEEQIVLLKSFAESQEQIEKNLTEAQKARIEQVQVFSSLLAGLQNALDGQNDAAFGKMSLWMAQKMQSADLENLKQFLKKFDPVDVSTYLIQNKNKTLYSYMSEKYPGQVDMLKRLAYHSAIPFYGTSAWGHENGEILADVHNNAELTRYRAEVVSFLRSDDSLGHYEMARSLAIEGLHDKFKALKGKVDEKKIREETDHKMKKEFGPEWETATLTALKASPENKGKTDEELKVSIDIFKQAMEQQTFKHLQQNAIGQTIFDTNDFSKYSPEEKALWDEYSDSMGFGVFNISDESWDSIATELAINAPLILISGGVANGVVKGLSMGARAILPEVIAQVGTRVGTRLSAYIAGKVALKTAQIALAMGVEGTSFEIVHHALAEGDLNMFNEPGWQSKILWSSLTLGAFKGVGRLQQTALLKSFAEKIATGAGDIAQLKGLNKVLSGFPVGMHAGFGKILYGMTAFEGSRQMEASVMFLTGAAQATLSGQDLDNFYANLYDYCVTNGGENYFHSMVSAHALNLAHTGIPALGKKIKDTLEQKKAPDKIPTKGNEEHKQSSSDVKNESTDVTSIMQKMKKEFPNSTLNTFEHISGWLKSFIKTDGLNLLSPIEILRGLNLHEKYPKVIFEDGYPYTKLHSDRLDFKGKFPAGFSEYVYQFASRERGGLITYTDILAIEQGELCKGENIIDRVRAEFSHNNSIDVSLLDSQHITPDPLFLSQKERYDFMVSERRSMNIFLYKIDNKIAEKLSPKILDESAKIATERIVTELLNSHKGKGYEGTISQECMARMLFATRACVKGYQDSLRLMNQLKDGSMSKRDLLSTLFIGSKKEIQDAVGEHIDEVTIDMSPIGGLILKMPGSLRTLLGDEISNNFVTNGFMMRNSMVGTITVIYTDADGASQESTLRHEEEHRINKFLFPENQEIMSPRETILSRTKDEILAFATGGNLSPKEFLPGGTYFEKYKQIHGDFPGIEIEMCDAMMLRDYMGENNGLGTYKSIYQFTPLSKWRSELRRQGLYPPPNTPEAHTAYLTKKYPYLQKYFSDQAILGKIPGKPPYNINSLIAYIDNPPKDLKEEFVFKLYGSEGLQFLKNGLEGKNLNSLDWTIFVSRMDFIMTIHEYVLSKDTVTRDVTLDRVDAVTRHIVHFRKSIKQHYGVEYLGELTGIQSKELIEGIVHAIQEHPTASESEVVNIFLQSRKSPQ